MSPKGDLHTSSFKAVSLDKIKREEEEIRAHHEADKLGFAYLDLVHVPVTIEALALLEEKASRTGRLAILQRRGSELEIAVRDPSQQKTKEMLEGLKQKGYKLNLFIASQSGLEHVWDNYKRHVKKKASLKEILRVEKKEFDTFEKEIGDIQSLREKITNISTIKLVSTVVVGAIKSRASDIHLEPGKDDVRLRYRIDGVLQDIALFKTTSYEALLSRFKILSGLKLNVRDINQRGGFTIQIVSGKEIGDSINVRTSIIPGSNGETIVIRLLEARIEDLSLDKLGMHEGIRERLKAELGRPNGMILSTGPTGSGKTTSMYTALQFLKSPKTKIITIEDPVEYHIPGIVQSQVDVRKGYTYPVSLRGILSQDPDVILVGEIRDSETAVTAVQASLTGHLVLATLHTNDAAGTIERLAELGVDRQTMPASLNAVIGQRLVRRLCEHCKEEYDPPKADKDAMLEALSLISPKSGVDVPREINKLFKAKGCDKCFGLGYKGRIGVFELFTVNDTIEKLILERATTYDIRTAAMQEGMVTMLQDGLMRVITGDTSLDEVQRVAGDAKYIESLYGRAITSLLSRALEVSKPSMSEVERVKGDMAMLQSLFLQVTSDKLLTKLAAGALVLQASDIHIEPQEDALLVRYRIDGILETVATLAKSFFLPLISEIKEFSGIDTAEHGKIQEGRFRIAYPDGALDTRVSMIPGGYGETVVIRLLQADIANIPLEDLGMRPEQLKQLDKEIRKPNGIVLATGPTSAGKSTTLYAVLARLNSPKTKIITIEDPIEYRLEGIVQTQVNKDEGYTFATALRSILRQNPNIILVGEVRDSETAQVALQASLTGHMILSTLHTNDAVSAIQRLSSLHVLTSEISTALNAVIAQRLVRRICKSCATKHTLTEDELKILEEADSTIPSSFKEKLLNAEYLDPKGCKECGPTGYKGQVGIYELFVISQEVRGLIDTNVRAVEIQKKAQEEGMLTLRQDGFLKAADRVTSLAEVLRVTKD